MSVLHERNGVGGGGTAGQEMMYPQQSYTQQPYAQYPQQPQYQPEYQQYQEPDSAGPGYGHDANGYHHGHIPQQGYYQDNQAYYPQYAEGETTEATTYPECDSAQTSQPPPQSQGEAAEQGPLPTSQPEERTTQKATSTDTGGGDVDEDFVGGVVDLLQCFVRFSANDTMNYPHTVFHSLQPPNVSVARYVGRLVKYSLCQTEDIVVALILLDRLLSFRSDLRINMLTFHRIFLTSMVVSIKSRQDLFYTNKYYAGVGGVQLAELNTLERHFLCAIDFQTLVSNEKYDEFMEQLQCRFQC